MLAKPVLVSATEVLPLTVSGSLGYSYRLLDGNEGEKAISRSALGSLHANTYIWRPWLATADANVTLAFDNSSRTSEDTSGYVNGESTIATGVLNLNALSQSRAPFTFRYAATDSRVDAEEVNSDAFIVLADGDAQTRRMELRQSYLFEGGHRIRGAYDNHRYYSDRAGYYDDEIFGLEVDLRPTDQHLIFNTKAQESTRSTANETNDIFMVDVSHYYEPSRQLRIDSKASSYEIERGFEVPDNAQNGLSISDIQQVSSFAFWRPQYSPWTFSGGLRMYSLDGENTGTGVENQSENLSATLGAIYQVNRALRFDGSASFATLDSNDRQTDITREHIGVLYQSDLADMSGYTWQWYSSGAVDNVDDGEGADQIVTAVAGHNLQRAWATSAASTVRLSFGQALNEIFQSDSSLWLHRLDHNATAGWHHSGVASSSDLRFTVADLRNFGDNNDEQQLVNVQATRDQRLSRRSSLSGNLTFQSVRQVFLGDDEENTVSTVTGRVDFRNIALFGVPRLGFTANALLSQTSEEELRDRAELGARLDYLIGQLTTNLSYRLIDYEDQRYGLTFFRIERQF